VIWGPGPALSAPQPSRVLRHLFCRFVEGRKVQRPEVTLTPSGLFCYTTTVLLSLYSL
jgi:hypothetical protein